MCLLTYTASEELLVAFSYVCWFIVHSSSLPFGHYTFFRDVGNSYLRVLLSLWVRSFSNAAGDFDFFLFLERDQKRMPLLEMIILKLSWKKYYCIVMDPTRYIYAY